MYGIACKNTDDSDVAKVYIDLGSLGPTCDRLVIALFARCIGAGLESRPSRECS